MMEVAQIGVSAVHEAFRAAQGLARLEVPDALPALESVTHLSWQFPGEHCTECAAPDCHASCALFERGPVGRCRRFEDGLVVRPLRHPLFPYLVEALFRPWGQIICVGNAWCVPRSRYARGARWIPRLGRLSFALQSAGRRLPARAQWRAADLIRGAGNRLPRLLNRWAARPGQPAPDALLVLVGNPHREPLRLEVTVSGFGASQGGRSYRTVAELQPGWNTLDLPAAPVWAVIDRRRLFRVCLVPLIEAPRLLEFLYLGWVRRARPAAPAPARKVKLVVFDLDNTLWDGILIENPDREYALRPGVRETLETLDQRGILMSVASKNNFDDARRVLERLGIWDLFLHPRIDWEPKSANLAQIVRELNLGADAAAFVDDAAFERAEVQAALPEVRVYDAGELTGLPARPEFDVPVTEDSRQRRRLYREEGRRQAEFKASAQDYEAFLRSCDIRLRLEPLDEQNAERVFELVQRTNQLNFSGTRYRREALDALRRGGNPAPVVLRCEDRFGSYGIVGFSLLSVGGGAAVLRDLMLSCRIQGKRIEHAYLAYLLRAAAEAGLERLVCRYVRTARNAPAARVFADLRCAPGPGEGGGEEYGLPVGADLPEFPARVDDRIGLSRQLRRLAAAAGS